MPCIRSHIRGKMLLPPAPSTNEACQPANCCGEPFSNDSAPGAAVSGSAPRMRTCGASWRTALPMPEISPPPPMAAMTVFTPGRSSRISMPRVALPAMKSCSSKGWTNVPSTPGNSRASMARQQASNGALTMRAPRLRMRSTFVSGAVSIVTTVAGTPAARAAKATPCPALPALIVHTPFCRSSGLSMATAFAPPRSLNALIGCRFSSLSQISGAAASWRSLTSGVRKIVFLIRSRAARISSRVTGRTGGGATDMARHFTRRCFRRCRASASSTECDSVSRRSFAISASRA